MKWKDRITLNPKIVVGKPVIAGTRIPVDLILTLLAQGVTVDELISRKYYPHLKREDVYAAISYASDRVKDERIYPLSPGDEQRAVALS